MLTIAADDVHLVIDPAAGGRAVSWSVAGIELLVDRGPTSVEYGMYPMAPWAGRLNDDEVSFGTERRPMPTSHEGRALHGTVLSRPMEIVDQSAGHVVLEQTLGTPWPWAGAVRLAWRVHATRVDAHIEITSDGEPFPAASGLHPWFRRELGIGGPLVWNFPDEATWHLAERGPAYTLTGRLQSAGRSDGPFDDAFHVASRHATVEWPNALSLDVRSSHDWFVVFDERPEAVCLEPQTGPPNGVNASALAEVAIVTPGRPLRMETSWTIVRKGDH